MNFFNANWVDLVILVIAIFFVLESLNVGFWIMLADFFSFFLSLLISLKTYSFAATFLKNNFSLGRSIANALGFLLIAILAEGILGLIFGRLLTKLPNKFFKAKYDKFLAIIPALGEALVLVSFVILLVLSFPINPKIKTDISDSKIGGYLIEKTSGIEAKLNDVFGGIIQDSLTYFTIEPGSKDRVTLNNETTDLTVDEKAEAEMFKLVNEERKKRGIPELTWKSELVPVARGHAADMWKRHNFGHYSPEGKDVGDRLREAGISYQIAGENLALAPTVQTAHQGLMNSEGHRENILDTRFHNVGIGVIDNGYYGKMFVQVFTD